MAHNKSSFFTLITGSSMGIGRAMAFECAQRGMNLVLVALEEALLREVKESIERSCDVEVITLSVDLTTADSVPAVLRACRAKGCRINFLINNAGLGAGGLFENISMETYEGLIDLNNKALVRLSYALLPDLLQNAPFFILNTSSIEATMPLPYKTVYTATKSFIYGFSLALNEEIRSRGGRVSVLCPGPVPTNEENIRRYISHGWKAKIIAKLPDEVARIGISSALRKKRVIVPGVANRLIVHIMHLMPVSVRMRILERLFRVYHDHREPL